MSTTTTAERLDDFMEKNHGTFSTAKGTLRTYLIERKRLIDAGEAEDLDQSTAQGIWYLVEPYIPPPTRIDKKTGLPKEQMTRRRFVSYIREICRDDLGCRREDLKIVAGGRADQYYNGEWTTISWDKLEELSESGTDGILIEKEGMSNIFCPFVDPFGFAIINSRGFFVDYLDDISEQAIEKKSNFVLLRDFDPSGILIEIGAKQLGIPCIGVNDDMLRYLGLTRRQVQDKHPPSNANNHWKRLKKLAATTHPEWKKELDYLSKYRIEIDKVHAKSSSKKMFEYVKYKLSKYHRDLNRVIQPSDYVQPNELGRLAFQLDRIGKAAAYDTVATIWREQEDFNAICFNIRKQDELNDSYILGAIESDEIVKWACKQLKPIVKYLEKIKVDKRKFYKEDDTNEQ